jgi:hypothetical protein
MRHIWFLLLITLTACSSTTAFPSVELIQQPSISHSPSKKLASTPSYSHTYTPSSSPTIDPTSLTITKAAENIHSLMEQCSGFTDIAFISPNTEWTICVYPSSITIFNYQGIIWEIQFTTTYHIPLVVANVYPYRWATDSSTVYIEYSLTHNRKSGEATIALWKVELSTGKITEILLSPVISQNDPNSDIYSITISPDDNILTYFILNQPEKIIIITNLSTFQKYSKYVGYGEFTGMYYWSPNSQYVVFTYWKIIGSSGIEPISRNNLYFMHITDRNLFRICSTDEENLVKEVTNDYILYENYTGIHRYMFL